MNIELKGKYSRKLTDFINSADAAYGIQIMKALSSFGDDPSLGMRSAGSPAEYRAVRYIEQEMINTGLSNVTVDKIKIDNWIFRGADITYTDPEGRERTIKLASYQTALKACNEKIDLIYAGKGTEADYEGIDASGSLVLIDIDQNEDWWINYPAYQAKVKGARALIAMSIYPEKCPERIGVQDIAGCADAPVLAISEKDSLALRDALSRAPGGRLSVILNADSEIILDGTSHNVWGEIPGRTDETIFLFAHLDGYFHSVYDDAEGAAISMVIAKGLIDSGFVPEKTIRICMHGAEEWGRSGSEYDWATGAYEEIMTTHPEWRDNAFVIVNSDGGYTSAGQKKMSIRSASELISFVKKSVSEYSADSAYSWKFDKTSVYTEDFQWSRCGIPAIVSCDDEEDSDYMKRSYHSTFDSWKKLPFDLDGYKEMIITFAKLIMDLDDLAVCPMDFSTRLRDFEDSLDDRNFFDDALRKAFRAAGSLSSEMQRIEETHDRKAAREMNRHTREIYQIFQDKILGLDFEPEAINRHELYQNNLKALDSLISSLREGNIMKAYDEYLPLIDWAWCNMNFDRKTCDHMERQLTENAPGTWGDGMIAFPLTPMGDIVDKMKALYDSTSTDLNDLLSEMTYIRDKQQEYLDSTYRSERAAILKAADLMLRYSTH